jgi:hypothetical protein
MRTDPEIDFGLQSASLMIEQRRQQWNRIRNLAKLWSNFINSRAIHELCVEQE